MREQPSEGQLRVSKKTRKKIISINDETDVRKALEGLVDLYENYVPEEKYSNGAWKSCRHFDFDVFYNGERVSSTGWHVLLRKAVFDSIKEDSPILVSREPVKYVFEFEDVYGLGDGHISVKRIKREY